MTQAVVIGGGPVGLSTAALLARGGLDVTLLERHAALGGRSAPLTLRGHTFDPSPWYLIPEAYEGFFSLVGRKLDDYLELTEPEMRFRAFFEEGPDVATEVLDLDLDTQVNWGRLEEVSPGDGEAARRLVLRAAERYQVTRDRLENMPYRGPLSFLRPSALRHLPWLAGGLMRSTGGEITRAIRHPHVRRVLEFPALALTGSPKTMPAAYSSTYYHHLGGAIRHPRGGFGSVIAALERIAREEGVDIRTESDVARILVDPLSRLASGIVLRTGDVIATDLVVSCVDPHHTETSLLTDEFRSYPEASWSRFRASPSALVATFGVKKKLPQLAHHNLFFPRNWQRTLAGLGTSPLDDPFASEFIYVGRPTATDPTMAPKGKESLVLIAPLPADPSLGTTEESRQTLLDLVARFLSQVGVMAEIPDLGERSQAGDVITPADLVERYSTWRGSGFGIAPTLRGLTWSRPGGASRLVRNLLYPGSSMLPGPGAPGAFVSAELVAKTLMGMTGAGRLPAPVEPGFLRATGRKDVIGELLRGMTTGETSGED
ncbi:MAG: phytoene desaturase family protein [Demequinaceae bacterium]|nr:phytoene desaturase family protein [Demequinaceae bacterium]